jgi:hypothetical protein
MKYAMAEVDLQFLSEQTMHLKLLNAIARSAHELNLSKEHDMSAHRFHSDLFASGFERIILVRLTWPDSGMNIHYVWFYRYRARHL